MRKKSAVPSGKYASGKGVSGDALSVSSKQTSPGSGGTADGVPSSPGTEMADRFQNTANAVLTKLTADLPAEVCERVDVHVGVAGLHRGNCVVEGDPSTGVPWVGVGERPVG